MALLNVGMPGVGLGGIFYVVAALAMPFVEGARALRARAAGERRPRDDRRWGLVLRQGALAVGVLGAAWLMGLGVARLRTAWSVASTVGGAGAHGALATTAPVRGTTLALGVGLLAAILVAIELLALVLPRHAAAPPDPQARRATDEPLREVA